MSMILPKRGKSWYVYLLRCNDHTLYCGIARDLQSRLDDHNDSKKGARYTRSRRPAVLIYFERKRSMSNALKREWAIKQLSRRQKEELISEWSQARTARLKGRKVTNNAD